MSLAPAARHRRRFAPNGQTVRAGRRNDPIPQLAVGVRIGYRLGSVAIRVDYRDVRPRYAAIFIAKRQTEKVHRHKERLPKKYL